MITGRPTKLNERTEDVVCQVLRATHNIRLACERASISLRVYHNWITQGTAELDDVAASKGVEASELAFGDVTFAENAHVHFLHATAQALADFETTNLAIIQKAAIGQEVEITKTKTIVKANGDTETTTEVTKKIERSWPAAAWLLERRIPADYSRFDRHEHSGPGGDPIPLALSTDEKRKEAAARMEQLAQEMAAASIPLDEESELAVEAEPAPGDEEPIA